MYTKAIYFSVQFRFIVLCKDIKFKALVSDLDSELKCWAVQEKQDDPRVDIWEVGTLASWKGSK